MLCVSLVVSWSQSVVGSEGMCAGLEPSADWAESQDQARPCPVTLGTSQRSDQLLHQHRNLLISYRTIPPSLPVKPRPCLQQQQGRICSHQPVWGVRCEADIVQRWTFSPPTKIMRNPSTALYKLDILRKISLLPIPGGSTLAWLQVKVVGLWGRIQGLPSPPSSPPNCGPLTWSQVQSLSLPLSLSLSARSIT